MDVVSFFEEISRIPRGSGNEKEISDYLVNFAKNRGLAVKQDEALNVIIYKPATPGREDRPPVLLQSHMDMVCEKNADTPHDFLTDPIKIRREGDFLYATGTTLGADNGVGVAIGLATLAVEDISHPPLEVLFTTEEETTMKGISALDASWLKARKMIGLDSGNDETFCVGCAGGCRFEFTVPVAMEMVQGVINKVLTVRGLHGGHSGAEIHLGRANSIKTLGRALDTLLSEIDIRIISVSGGLKANAIPREADAVIAIKPGDVGRAEQIIADLEKTLRTEYRVPDPAVTLSLDPLGDGAEDSSEAFTRECARSVISAMILLPYGPLFMSADIPGLVEASNNVGVMQMVSGGVTMDSALRSSVHSRMQFIRTQIKTLADALGATVTFTHGYPGWTYNPQSPLLAVATDEYQKLYGKKPNIEAIHAGLECGFMLEKIPDMDIISYCARIYDAHTPDEHLSLSSLDRVWKYTVALLNRL